MKSKSDLWYQITRCYDLSLCGHNAFFDKGVELYKEYKKSGGKRTHKRFDGVLKW